MPDDPSITTRFGADEPLVHFPAERVTTSVPLTPLGDPASIGSTACPC